MSLLGDPILVERVCCARPVFGADGGRRCHLDCFLHMREPFVHARGLLCERDRQLHRRHRADRHLGIEARTIVSNGDPDAQL